MTRHYEIETARLKLRQFSLADLDNLAAIRADAEVMRYIGNGEPATREQAVEHLTRHMTFWKEDGIGHWAVVHKEHNRLIGWAGLRYLDGTEEVEVGYGLARKYWGQGLATEAAAASLRFGFEALGLDRIVAVAIPENAASRRVMEKLGMVYVRLARFYGSDVAYYEIARDRFRCSASYYLLRDNS